LSPAVGVDSDPEVRLPIGTAFPADSATAQHRARLRIHDRQLEIVARMLVGPSDEETHEHSGMLERTDLGIVKAQDPRVGVNGQEGAHVLLREFAKNDSFSCEFHLRLSSYYYWE
jgi:hypothetical protein